MSRRIEAWGGKDLVHPASWIVVFGSWEPVALTSATVLPAVDTANTATHASPRVRSFAAPIVAISSSSGPMNASSLNSKYQPYWRWRK